MFILYIPRINIKDKKKTCHEYQTFQTVSRLHTYLLTTKAEKHRVFQTKKKVKESILNRIFPKHKQRNVFYQ